MHSSMGTPLFQFWHLEPQPGDWLKKKARDAEPWPRSLFCGPQRHREPRQSCLFWVSRKPVLPGWLLTCPSDVISDGVTEGFVSRLRSELNPALHMFGDLWCPWGHAVLRAGWREDYTAHMPLPNTSQRREKANTQSSLPLPGLW